MFTLHENNSDHKEGCCSAHEAGRKVREVIDHATHDAKDAMAATEGQIRRDPVKATMIAAGLGFLLGAFLRRR